MNTLHLKSLLAAGVLMLAPRVFAAPHTPRVGSPERTALMNSLRKVLGSGRHKPIITPYHFKVERNWAYISGGFNYQTAPLEPQWREGSGTNFSALLQKQGKSWKVKRRAYHGDVVAPDFMRDFPSAPRAIFR
ncbi:MAG TPA: hypothetical protein VF627_09310 [Abditibacterium sp.]|jgi:hypothetical protein